MKKNPTLAILTAASLIFFAIGPVLPRWAMFLINVSLCYGIVVLGMMLLMRTGVVSFGHGLYYCLGAYASGTIDQVYKISDMSVMLLAAVLVTALASAALGLLLRKYRDIFFAMLSLAFSMILYGLLVKTSALGSSDGFNITASRSRASPSREQLGIATFAMPSQWYVRSWQACSCTNMSTRTWGGWRSLSETTSCAWNTWGRRFPMSST